MAIAGPALLAVAAAAQEVPFTLRTLRVPGRVVDVVAAPAGGGSKRARLVVASVAGSPPDEERRLSVFPPLRPETDSPAPAWSVEVGPEVVAFDVADVRPAPGPEILLLSAHTLRILGAGGMHETLSLPVPLPLPPRSWGLSRLPFVRDWSGDGKPAALLPATDGALLVPLDGGPTRLLAIPVLSDYETPGISDPIYRGYAKTELVWPGLFLGDDDGDGRLDLFAVGRFGMWVFRSGPKGLPSAPTRQARLRPFPFQEELRHEVNTLTAVVRDLDGDGRADLVVHRTGGGLLHSHASTHVYLNDGRGAQPMGRPSATLNVANGIGSVILADLDGDGRVEIVQSAVPFGVLQVVRVLVRRQLEAKLSVYRFPSKGRGPLVLTWDTELDYPVDFDLGRVAGLLPDVDGDWNGDGRRDLLTGAGPGGAVQIRLGQDEPAGPGFGPVVAEQDVPLADRAVVADLDGDGLDDLVAYDPADRSGRVVLCWNRGLLPGTPPRMRAGKP